ncbi:hypothetical protein [Paraclostridium dentum]|uniref:hypothetical protein n=1 Tax=Paraclostridium dentum TaxID=2662455 RepID=UPI003F38044A
MVQKIGLKKTNKNYLNYFKKLKKDNIIEINNIKDISSVIINAVDINTKLLPKLNKIRIQFVVEINLIYSTTIDMSLCAYKYSYVYYETIAVPKIIKGYNILSPNFLNKLQKEINVEEINIKINNSKVNLSYFLIINLKIPPTHSIAYIIDNGFGNNVFLSHNNGTNLTQKTFFQGHNIDNIFWDTDNLNLWFIYSNLNNSSLHFINCENGNINVCKNVNIEGFVNSFVFKNKNEIIFSTTNKIIYTYNLLSENIKPLLSLHNKELVKQPYYNKSKNLIYFLMSTETDFNLYSVDQFGNIDTIFNYTNVLDYYVSCCEDFLTVKVIKDGRLNLFEIDLSSKLINQIFLNDNAMYDILGLRYMTYKGKKSLLLLSKNEVDTSHCNTFYIYNFETYTFEKLIDTNCTYFDIDEESLDLFMVTKEKNISSVNKLNLKEGNVSLHLETILKIPGDIKSLNIKKV